jgi:hypothetical protein
MAGHELTKRYGVRPVHVNNKHYEGFADEPLTEGQIRENLDNEHNARLQKQHNHLCRRLIHVLDDKIFVADSLRFVASLVTGQALEVPPQRLEYEEANEALLLPEKEKIMRVRLTDANLTLPSDIRTLKTFNKLLLSKNSDPLIQPKPNTLDIFIGPFSQAAIVNMTKTLVSVLQTSHSRYLLITKALYTKAH